MNLVPASGLLGGIVAAGPVAAAMGLLVTGLLTGATLVLVLGADRKRRTRLSSRYGEQKHDDAILRGTRHKSPPDGSLPLTEVTYRAISSRVEGCSTDGASANRRAETR